LLGIKQRKKKLSFFKTLAFEYSPTSQLCRQYLIFYAIWDSYGAKGGVYSDIDNLLATIMDDFSLGRTLATERENFAEIGITPMLEGK
jgi:hypothetical protein